MEKCPDCKKYFEEDWKGQKFCPHCGQSEEQARAKISRAAAVKVTAVKTIERTPEEQFILNLIEKMYTEHGFDYHPTVFRNRQTSYEQRINGQSQIVLGYASIRRAYEEKFNEYRSINWVWGGQGALTGLKGVWALALHEFAHVIQEETGTLYSSKSGGIDRNKFHNSNFIKALQDLQTLYPFNEQI